MSHPSGCDWWTGKRLRMYGRKVCPCCKGTAKDHLNRATAAAVRPVKRCVVCGSPFYTFPSCRCGYGPEHNR